MRSKHKILKDIDEHISNLKCAMIDNDLDKDFPPDIKKEIVNGYKSRISELKDIRSKLEKLLA